MNVKSLLEEPIGLYFEFLDRSVVRCVSVKVMLPSV